ncbi:MAG: SGNH/GDSL hydrolase family protein [Verrucomicrobiota bacterium]
MRSIVFTLVAAATSITAVFAEAPIRPGDRVAIVGNTFADQIREHGYLETLLLQRTGENPVSIRNLGWGGDMLTLRDRPTNFPTEESTLTDHQTDVIIACFGLGESFNGEAGIEDFKKDVADFIASHAGKKYNGKKAVRLVLVSPIAHEDLGRLTPMAEKRNGQLEAYTNAMGAVAAEHGVPFVDLYTPMKYIMEEPEAPKLTTNGIHLNPYGYWAAARLMLDALVAGENETVRDQPWRITIDAESGSAMAQGLSISEVSKKAKELSFVVTEESGPTLPPPTNELLPLQLEEFRDRMVVANLPSGVWVLKVDGNIIASAGHIRWAQGVAIDLSPAHDEAEALREAVNDKNRQFVYSWKAYNQVHIVGERRSSPSGQALPGEVIEFNNITKQRDAALRESIELKTRQWQLVLSSD